MSMRWIAGVLTLLAAAVGTAQAACDATDGTTYFTISFVQGPRGFLNGFVATDCGDEHPPTLAVPVFHAGGVEVHEWVPVGRDELGGWMYHTNLRVREQDKILVRVPGHAVAVPCLPSAASLLGRRQLWCVGQEWFDVAVTAEESPGDAGAAPGGSGGAGGESGEGSPSPSGAGPGGSAGGPSGGSGGGSSGGSGVGGAGGEGSASDGGAVGGDAGGGPGGDGGGDA